MADGQRLQEGEVVAVSQQILAVAEHQRIQANEAMAALQDRNIPLQVAVMGCVVNGPGESKLANIGISLPGTGETPVAPVYVDGEKTVTLKGERIAEEFQAIVEEYVASHYATSRAAAPASRLKQIPIRAVDS